MDRPAAIALLERTERQLLEVAELTGFERGVLFGSDDDEFVRVAPGLAGRSRSSLAGAIGKARTPFGGCPGRKGEEGEGQRTPPPLSMVSTATGCLEPSLSVTTLGELTEPHSACRHGGATRRGGIPKATLRDPWKGRGRGCLPGNRTAARKGPKTAGPCG